MSHITERNKKMTFDEYQNKFSSKQQTNKGKIKNQTTKTNSISRPQYSQKKFNQPKASAYPQQQSSKTTNQNFPLHSQQQVPNNHNQNQQTSQLSIPLPISHKEYVSFNKNTPLVEDSGSGQKDEVNKIDLIFEKEPQDVQRKLRMLLLNYNAVMQYNQEEDKFEVDLLLPFQTIDEKQNFIKRFNKTRQQIKEQISNKQTQHQADNQGDYPMENYNNGHENENENTSDLHERQNNHNMRPNFQHQYINQVPIGGAEEDYSSQMREQAQQKEKQLMQKRNQVDFYELGQSIDLSIQRAMNLIKIERKPSNQQIPNHSQKEQSNRINDANYDSSVFESSQNHQIEQLEAEQVNTNYNRTRFEQGYSQVESQISQGLKPNHPYQLERNIENTPSGYDKTSSRLSWMQPLQSSQFQGSMGDSFLNQNHQQPSQYSTLFNNSIYESPIVPLKHSQYQAHQRSNASSNQILIEDEASNQIESYGYYGTPQRNHQKQQIDTSSEYNSAFDMIEETAEEHQEEIFTNPKQYQQFLKKKLNSLAVNNIPNQPSKKPNPSQGRSSLSSNPSLRRKYSDFLNTNKKKIQSLYLRIGKQMQKRKNQQAQRKNAYASRKSSQRDEKEEILVLDDDNQTDDRQIQEGMLEDFRKRIVLENQSMSSEDKVRYFRYLARHAKGLYIDYIKSQSPLKKG